MTWPAANNWRKPWPALKRWLAAHHLRLITIQDTPHSIALGSAIGIFFGFTPLFGLKTLISIGVAWIFRSNKIAAAISVTLHDVLLPLMPAIYLWEYKLGFLAFHGRMPQRTGSFRHLKFSEYMNWTTFLNVGFPVLLGSLFLALPCAVAVYIFMRGVVEKARAVQRETPPAVAP